MTAKVRNRKIQFHLFMTFVGCFWLSGTKVGLVYLDWYSSPTGFRGRNEVANLLTYC